jgi:pyruvate,water dikinase
MAYVLPLADPKASLLETSGGKGSSLARLVQAGLQVPGGFVVTSEAYWKFISENQLQATIMKLMGSVDDSDRNQVEEQTAKIRASIVASPIPKAMARDIVKAYEALGEQLFVAVRSSGTAEDLAEASFAGQHDTYLDIQGNDDVLDAVRRCWASLWTARAVVYRGQKGFDHSAVRLAVVVQEMIASEVSGVMFTANPVTAATDELVINASYGLGEGIVSGMVEPDQFVLKHNGLRIKAVEVGSKQLRVVRDAQTGHGVTSEPVPEPDRARLSLDAHQVQLVGKLGRRVQALYDGMPQDIEWALANGNLYLLQSRDITGVDFSWDEELEVPTSLTPEPDDNTIWTRAWGDAVFPGPVTPFFYSMRVEGFWRCHRWAQTLWGMPQIGALHLTKYHRGRVYYNTSIDYGDCATFVPPFLRLPDTPLMAMIPAPDQEALAAEPWSWTSLLNLAARIRVLDRDHGLQAAWKNLSAQFERAEEALGPGPEAIAELDDQELEEYFDSRCHKQWEWWEDHWSQFFLFLPLVMSALQYMVNEWYHGTNPGIFTDLFTGLPPTTATLRETTKLWELSELIRNDEELRSLFAKHEDGAFFQALAGYEQGRAFLARYSEFLAEFGHRGQAERDIRYDRRIENPAIDYASFKVLLSGESVRPDATFADQVARRDAAKADMEASISKQPLALLKIEAFRLVQDWLLKLFVVRDNERHHTDRYTMSKKWAVSEIKRRLEERGVLQGDDMWFLSKREVYKLLDGAPRTRLIDARIAGRQRNWQLLRDGYIPPMYLQDNHFIDLDTPASLETSDGVYKGKPMSQGEVTGIARVIPNQEEIGRVQKGDIMVCDSTDPGWTPAFFVISGLVVQTGGVLSHAACLSREYGLPAVQLPGAVALIEDGTTIAVNGNTGSVRIVARPEPLADDIDASVNV